MKKRVALETAATPDSWLEPQYENEMVAENYIVDTPLPDNRNFTYLKDIGLNSIKGSVGAGWSNFNESDPGVTILDQLCYALTELGYCNNFPIEDILTRSDGKIPIEDHFFSPDQILTCAPITIDDYRKLIIDALAPIKNVLLRPIKHANSVVNGIYQVYLHVDFRETTRADYETWEKEIENAAYYLLHRFRNVAELFLPPKVLKPVTIRLTGQIILEDNVSPADVWDRLLPALEHYIWPVVKQYGYKDLESQGEDANSIFNGPRLKNGWIPADELAHNKRDTIRSTNLMPVIAQVEGVKSIRKLDIELNGRRQAEIKLAIDQIAHFDVSEESLELIQNNSPVGSLRSQPMKLGLSHSGVAGSAGSIGAALDLLPPVPDGRFRDISDYYSIQNTFPEIYAIGHHTPEAGAAPYRIAQSRQLRGYLTIFDQLLANQFSQLANVNQLFSFKQAITPDPEDRRKYLADQDLFFRGYSSWPIPYLKFSPTYFCQALYDIPEIRPLLAGYETYDFHTETEGKAESAEKSWAAYKNDPYNQYIYGLMKFLEDADEVMDRRNRMLDHLLARHGEAATFYEQVITLPQWCGSTVKTRILIKSMILQNYHLLSYNRQKAHNFLGASAIGPLGRFKITRQSLAKLHLDDVPDAVLTKLKSLTNKGFATQSAFEEAVENTIGAEFYQQHKAVILKYAALPAGEKGADPIDVDLYRDFELDVEKLEQLQEIKRADFTDFSTFELKLNALLGLRRYYYLLISIIESLLVSEDWQAWIAGKNGNKEKFNLPDTDIKIVAANDRDQIFAGSQLLLEIVRDNDQEKSESGIQVYRAHADQLRWLADERKGFLFLENILLLKTAKFEMVLRKSDRTSAAQFKTVLRFDDCIILHDGCLNDTDAVQISTGHDNSIALSYQGKTYDFSTTPTTKLPPLTKYHEITFNGTDQYSIWFAAVWSTADKPVWKYLDHPFFFLRTSMLLPEYVTSLTKSPSPRNSDDPEGDDLPAPLMNAINAVSFETLPAHIVNTIKKVSFKKLKAIIPAFIHWHNDMRFDSRGAITEPSSAHAGVLADHLFH